MARQISARRQLHVGVVGVPLSKGQPRGGTEQGPALLREHGIVQRIEDLGNEVSDYGDLDLEAVEDDKPWEKAKNPRTVGLANKKLSDAVAKITRKGQIALTLGGDHSIATGSIHGHMQTNPNLVVVWIDAHADINTPLSSTSGNIHGMPLSFIVKEMAPNTISLPGYEWCQPCLSATDLIYIGLREVDEAERAYMTELGIACYSMQEVDTYNMPDLMAKVLKTVDPSSKRPIHLSFDIDAMDPEFAPSTGTAVPGGLTRREMYCIGEEIARTGRLACMDVVEVNPLLGTEADREKTAKTTVDVVSHFFGKRREGNVSIDFKKPLHGQCGTVDRSKPSQKTKRKGSSPVDNGAAKVPRRDRQRT